MQDDDVKNTKKTIPVMHPMTTSTSSPMKPPAQDKHNHPQSIADFTPFEEEENNLFDDDDW